MKDPGTPLGTHVFIMAAAKAGASSTGSGAAASPSWTGVGITGHMDDSNRPPDPEAKKRIHIADAFLHKVKPVLAVGTTLMITDEPVLESTTGKSLAVLSSSPQDVSTAPKK